jgi:hypothetical protein
MDNLCKHCGGPIAIRNPTGTCEHLYWPDNLTDEAKCANGFVKVVTERWVSADDAERARAQRDFDINGQDRW